MRCFGVPHFPISVNITRRGRWIDRIVVAAKCFEDGEAFGDAGAVEKMVEGVLDLFHVARAGIDQGLGDG